MLVATDLDGTLVPYDAEAPSPRTAAVLRRLDRAGVPVVFVTARPLRWMEGFWPHVGRHGLAVVSNGAIVFDVHERTVRTLTGIAPAAGLGLVAAIERAVPGAAFAVECSDGVRLDPRYADPFDVPADAPRGELAEVWDLEAAKLLVRHADLDPDELQERVGAAVGDTATATWSVPGLVEISASGVTKASGLVGLCEELGVGPEEVVAFGDMPNDLPMLAWAGTSYAVADAHPTVLAAADHVAPSCHDDGVAQVLDDLLEGRPAPG